jgi:hypothetical protein
VGASAHFLIGRFAWRIQARWDPTVGQVKMREDSSGLWQAAVPPRHIYLESKYSRTVGLQPDSGQPRTAAPRQLCRSAET